MTKTCPKCNSEMEKGLILTPGGVVGASWLSEQRVNQLLGAVHNAPQIKAYKCVSCGYVENYVEG